MSLRVNSQRGQHLVPAMRLGDAAVGTEMIVRNAAHTLIRQAGSLVLGLTLSIVFARSLGPDGNGEYALAVLFPTLLVTFLNLGVGSANVYFVGHESVSFRSAWRTSLEFTLGLSALGLCAGVAIITFWSDSWFPGIKNEVLLLALAGFPFTLFQAVGLVSFRRSRIFAALTGYS